MSSRRGNAFPRPIVESKPYDRRKHWLTDGRLSLVDQPRCGTPLKLTEVHREKFRTWACDWMASVRIDCLLRTDQ